MTVRYREHMHENRARARVAAAVGAQPDSSTSANHRQAIGSSSVSFQSGSPSSTATSSRHAVEETPPVVAPLLRGHRLAHRRAGHLRIDLGERRAPSRA